jgi:uridine phosphorylase
MPRRLRPTAEIHSDAILVGDPGRAMALAQVLTEKPQMANHARGLWGYSGTTAAGRGLTVQSTGMGGPSAALVLADLAELGVERAVRVGTCAAIDPAFGPGDLVWVRAARPWSVDHPGSGSPVRPDERLAENLRLELGESAKAGRVASLDFLHPAPDAAHAIPDGDVADMQTAALLTVGGRLGMALAAVLIVTDAEDSETLDDEKLLSQSETAAQAGLRALL